MRRAIYAPSALEQKAIEHLLQKRYKEARSVFQQALIEDPTRAWRIADQWEAETGRRGFFSCVTSAVLKNDLDAFEEGLEREFAAHNLPRPVNTETSLARARYLINFLDEPPIRKTAPPAYREPGPLLEMRGTLYHLS